MTGEAPPLTGEHAGSASPVQCLIARAPRGRPPAWMIAVTALLALAVLAMAVAETNLWLHYLIDAGEPISLAGLVFVALAGAFLYSRRQLRVSLPLMAPWLLFPVITQGDQIIDNLSINWMRAVVHLLLGLIFGIPVAVIVAGARAIVTSDRAGGWVRRSRAVAAVPGLLMIATGRAREGTAVLAAWLMALLTLVAVQFLGTLMVATLVVMIWGVLWLGFLPARPQAADAAANGRSERVAAVLLTAGMIASLGLYVGYKHRPGAYQGSPSYYMDPAQHSAGFRLDQVRVPDTPATPPADPHGVTEALSGYGVAFERLSRGYYILDRNYNYDFHNRLFLRSTPLLPDYRRVGLGHVHEAMALRSAADARAEAVRRGLADTDPLAALVDDVRAYASFTFGRVPVLERMSAEFERTEAGLQHATHLFEGEGKVLGVRLADLLAKHRRILSSPEVAPVTSKFDSTSRAVHDLYANRIVGF